MIISGLAIVDDILITSAEAFDDICVAGAELMIIPPFLGMIYSSIIAAISVIFDGIEIILRLTMSYTPVFIFNCCVLLYGIFTGHLLLPIMKCTASSIWTYAYYQSYMVCW